MPDRRFVYIEEPECFHVKDHHRQWIALEEVPVLLLALLKGFPDPDLLRHVAARHETGLSVSAGV